MRPSILLNVSGLWYVTDSYWNNERNHEKHTNRGKKLKLNKILKIINLKGKKEKQIKDRWNKEKAHFKRSDKCHSYQ